MRDAKRLGLVVLPLNRRKTIALCLAVIVPAPLVIQPVQASTYSVSSDNSIRLEQGTFSEQKPLVYGEGSKSLGGAGSVVKDGLPILKDLVGGGGLNGALPGLVNLGVSKLPKSFEQYGGLITPVLGGLISGNGIDFGSLATGSVPMLTKLLKLDGTGAKVLGNLTPVLGQLLSGDFSVGSLLNTGLNVLGGFLGNNPIFSTTSGILGGLFGGGGAKGTGIELSGSLAEVYSNPITAAINGQIFSGDASGASTSNTVLARTGSVLCLYNSSCMESNPTSYRSLYATAAGAMNVSSPNEVRAKIAELSKKGVRPDAFSSKFNSEQNAYYMGNYADRELSRASTEQYLSKQGQAAQKKAIQAAQKTAQTLTQLSDQCDKTAKSSQDLIRCNMKVNTAVPAFQAAQIELATNAQIDNQFMKNSLGNISAATDGLNREQDIERSAYAAALFQELSLSMPISGRKK